MNEDRTLLESILAVDCGSATTHALLLDVVDGTYRLVARATAPSTYGPPTLDLAEGVRHAIERIEQISGRKLFDEGKALIMPSRGTIAGIDLFVATASAAPPLKVVVAGLMEDISLATARRAMQGTYARIADTLSLTDGRSEESRLSTLVGLAPDAVVMVGGTDGGATDPLLGMLDTLVLASSVSPQGGKLRLVYAGNAELAETITEIVGGHAELHLVENVRPSLEVEQLGPVRAELDSLYEQNKMGHLPGFSELRGWSSVPVLPTAQAFGRVIRYLSVIRQKPVLGVDIGAATTTVAAAFEKELYLTVRDDLGLGHSVVRLLQNVPAEDVLRWLPYEYSADDLLDFAWNKQLRPTTVPQETHELLLEQALAREALRAAVLDARSNWPAPRGGWTAAHALPRFAPIIASGGLINTSNTPRTRAGQVALLLLDALQPAGITWLLVDDYGLLPALGAAATVKPVASVQTLDSPALTSLGTVVTPVGQARAGDIILKVQMAYDSGGLVEIEVNAGALEVLPLLPGQRAELTLQPQRRNIDVGLGPGRSGTKVEAFGGLVGLVIDARGRPLVLPADDGERRQRVQGWLWDMGG